MDNGYVSNYLCDAGGERTVKQHGSGEEQKIMIQCIWSPSF